MRCIKVIDRSEAEVEGTFYIEIDERSFEIRKVELYNGALLGFACADVSFNGTELPKTQLLSADEINELPGMFAVEIDIAEFEDIWQRAVIAAKE